MDEAFSLWWRPGRARWLPRSVRSRPRNVETMTGAGTGV